MELRGMFSGHSASQSEKVDGGLELTRDQRYSTVPN